jgi:hypothetical protein
MQNLNGSLHMQMLLNYEAYYGWVWQKWFFFSPNNINKEPFSNSLFCIHRKKKADRRKKRRAVEEKEKDPLKGQSSKRKKLNSLWCCPHSMKAECTSNIHFISCL